MPDPDRFLAYLNREYGDVARSLERRRRRLALVPYRSLVAWFLAGALLALLVVLIVR